MLQASGKQLQEADREPEVLFPGKDLPISPNGHELTPALAPILP